MKRRGICVLVLAGAFLPTPLGAQAPSPTPRSYKSHPVDTAHGAREWFLLWPEGAPGAQGALPQDRPKLTVYRATARVTGAAAVVCPGGSYRHLASDHEGKQVAEWLNSLGISAFVLQYRVGPRYRHPTPYLDAQRALRLVRSKAASFGIDAARLGIVGFSAGGHLASSVATRFDAGRTEAADPVERVSSRPDFMVLGYPVISLASPHAHRGSLTSLLGDAPDPVLARELSGENRVTAETPPAFLFHTADDPVVPVENSLAFFGALKAAKVPTELHVFAHGPHGVGLAGDDPVLSAWPGLCAAWLEAMGFAARNPPASSQL